MAKTKILIISHGFYPAIGGIESISEMIGNEFAKKNDVRLITLSKNSLLSGDSHFLFTVLRNPSFLNILKEFFWADIIFENNPCYRLSWFNFFIRKPSVVVLQTWLGFPDEKTTFLNMAKKLLLNAYSQVISISKCINDNVFPKGIIIPNPFQSDLFRIIQDVKRANTFVFLGRLVSDKGADLAILALDELLKRGYNYKLTIIGDGPEKSFLLDLVNNLKLNDNVIFLGSLKGFQLVEELNRHKAMVIPSRWREPFGIVALEAIAAGCIPIVADGGGLPDAIGNCGITFSRNNVIDLADKMLRVQKDDTLLINFEVERPKQLKLHSMDIIAKQYLEVMNSCLGK